MRMEKRKFRIGELAKQLEIERFVIRFWEKEFNLKPTRSTGKQRFYDEDDLSTFQTIKKLLYEQGFTISGAKKQLKKNSQLPLKVIASSKTTMDNHEKNSSNEISSLQELDTQNKELTKQIIYLQKQLLKLKELL